MTHWQAQIADLVDQNFAAQTAFLRELVRLPTDTPPGDNAPHAEHTARLLEAMGYRAERHAVPVAEVEAAGLISLTNLIVRRCFGAGSGFGLCTHGGVVPAGWG